MNPFVIAFRRIIYSIPLKRLLVGLAVFAVLFSCFSSAGLVKSSYAEYVGSQNDKTYINNSCDMICINPDGANCRDINLAFNLNHSQYAWSIRGVGDIGNTYGFCTNEHTVYFSSFDGCNFTIDCYNFTEYSSLQCQTEYNLIPISSVDQNYCTTNNLCPSVDCPEYPDNPNLGTSNIYINDIFHPGAFNVIMNIPEEIDWDYAYTNSGQNFNIDVVGYNQDFEKIESWIATNNYKPSSEDFTNIFTSGFSNFGGLLVAALFVILVFYFVKKLFK